MNALRILFCAALSSLLIVAAGATDVTLGTVKTSALNVRSSPVATASILTVAKSGDSVVVLEQQGDWAKVLYREYEGYMALSYLDLTVKNGELNRSGVISGKVVNVRTGPSLSAAILGKLNKDHAVSVTGVEDGWYRIKYAEGTGYVHPDYLKLLPVRDTASSGDLALRDAVVAYSKQFLGTRYAYGGRSPSAGFDCSGFVYYVFKNFGYKLSPGASRQMGVVTEIQKSELLPGDLVFFNTGSASRASHVGIFVGDGKFIHAVSPGKALSITSLSDPYYKKYYVGSGRVLS